MNKQFTAIAQVFTKKLLAFFIAVVILQGCAMISKQYYYVPSGTHQTIKGRFSHSDYKMIYSKVSLSNNAGDSIGSIATSNGKGHPLLMGPLLPVIPVGGFFQKKDNQFVMDMTVNCNEVDVKSNQCYMIVNDTLKVPLQVGKPTDSHSYRMSADIGFRKVKSLKLITGNTLLDSTLKQVTFKRKSRIKFDLVGPGY